MSLNQKLREDTKLVGKYFPINIFHNSPEHHNILHLHWHDNHEIIYITQGHAVFHIGNQEITAYPDDILFVNSKQLHSGYSIDNTHVDYYAIVFNKSLLVGSAPDPYLLKYISPFMDGRFQFPKKIEKNSPNFIHYKQTIQNIIGEFNKKKPCYELAVKSYLQILIISLFRDYASQKNIQSQQEKYEREIERFKDLFDYVEKHFPEKITIKNAAQIVNLSPYYFCKIFKKITGRTFLEFLNLYRVNQAEEMLRRTSLPITQVAAEVGFSNINYFSKVFKKYKRYSPSQCRK